MQHRPIKALLIESDEGYLDELREGLSEAHVQDLELEWVGELSQALARLSHGGFDAILLCLDLSDSQGSWICACRNSISAAVVDCPGPFAWQDPQCLAYDGDRCICSMGIHTGLWWTIVHRSYLSTVSR